MNLDKLSVNSSKPSQPVSESEGKQNVCETQMPLASDRKELKRVNLDKLSVNSSKPSQPVSESTGKQNVYETQMPMTIKSQSISESEGKQNVSEKHRCPSHPNQNLSRNLREIIVGLRTTDVYDFPRTYTKFMITKFFIAFQGHVYTS